jgi:hypothetical protein
MLRIRWIWRGPSATTRIISPAATVVIAVRSITVPAARVVAMRALTVATTIVSGGPTWTGGAIGARLRLIHANRSVAKHRAVQRSNRIPGALVACHLDEAEALALASIAIHDDLGLDDVPKS